jgi:hypothetical protein
MWRGRWGLTSELKNRIPGRRAKAGLLRITAPPPNIVATKDIISSGSIGAGQTVTLRPATEYKFAIMLFHGDGNPDVEVRLQGATLRTINGNEQAIELVAEETITITARNNNASLTRNHPTIEILALDWG